MFKIGEELQVSQLQQLVSADYVLAPNGSGVIKKLGFDTAPKKNSKKLLTSGAIYDAIGSIEVTSSGESSGGDDAFKTITIVEDSGFTWGQLNNVVADQAADTLQLVGGSGIEIEADNNNDAIRIRYDGSVGPLSGLSDVSITTPTANQVLTYQGGLWVNADSINVLANLNDANISTPLNSEILRYSSLESKWVNDDERYLTTAIWNVNTGEITLGRSGLSDLVVDIDGRYPTAGFTSVDIDAVTPDWDGAPVTPSGIADTLHFVAGTHIFLNKDGGDRAIQINASFAGLYLDDIADVSATSPGANQVLTYQGGYWVAADSINILNGLNDVDISTPVLNDVLYYDGSNWANRQDRYLATGSWDSGSGVITLTRTGGLSDITIDIDGRYAAYTFQTIDVDTNSGYTWNGAPVTATSSSDTLTLVEGSNVTLVKDGTNKAVMISATAGAPASIDDIGDVTLTSPQTNDVLRLAAGGQWVNTTGVFSQWSNVTDWNGLGYDGISYDNDSILMRNDGSGQIHLDAGTGAQTGYIAFYRGVSRSGYFGYQSSVGSTNGVRLYMDAGHTFSLYAGNHEMIKATSGAKLHLAHVNEISMDWLGTYGDMGSLRNHGIFSVDSNNAYNDDIAIHSYGDITLRMDTNNNNTGSIFRIYNNALSGGSVKFQVEGDSGNTYQLGAWRTGGLSSNGYNRSHTWIQFESTYGLYFPNSSAGTHFNPNTTTTYGGFQTSGSKGSYDGIVLNSSYAKSTFMSRTSDYTHGVYNQRDNGWSWLYTNLHVHEFKRADSSAYASVTAGDFYLSSDGRVKENERPLEDWTDRVKRIGKITKRYDRIDTGVKDEIGMIAQELKKIAPEFVRIAETEELEDFHSVNYAKMITPVYQVLGKVLERLDNLERE